MKEFRISVTLQPQKIFVETDYNGVNSFSCCNLMHVTTYWIKDASNNLANELSRNSPIVLQLHCNVFRCNLGASNLIGGMTAGQNCCALQPSLNGQSVK